MAFEGPSSDKLLLSGILRKSVPDTTQIEIIYVDEELRESKTFFSFFQRESEMKIFANASSTESEPFQMTIGMKGYEEDDTSRFKGTLQVSQFHHHFINIVKAA